MMPRSAKGRGKKRIERRPIPIPPSLVAKLRAAAGDRPANAPLLQRADGRRGKRAAATTTCRSIAPWRRPGCRKVVPYSLRHSSITRALLRGVPVRVVADLHDTSVAMLEKTYSKWIGDHSDAMVRAAQIDLSRRPPDRGGAADVEAAVSPRQRRLPLNDRRWLSLAAAHTLICRSPAISICG